MAKGEIACFEQFLLLSLCFQTRKKKFVTLSSAEILPQPETLTKMLTDRRTPQIYRQELLEQSSQKPSAAEASESVYMRERVNICIWL